MRELSLFSGIGGGIYGSLILGWETSAYVEKETYCQEVLTQRIKDGWFHDAPIYGDIKEFNKGSAHEYTDKIDVLTGGFPCQPHSVAGKRKGTSDERYLWDEIFKTISIVRPKRCLFENVEGLLRDGAIIDIIRGLESCGYSVKRPLLLGSDDCGNIHHRKRVWIYAANPASNGERGETGTGQSAFTNESALRLEEGRHEILHTDNQRERIQRGGEVAFCGQPRLSRRKDIRSIENLFGRSDIPTPIFRGVDDELPDWRKQLKAIGNGQDPVVMATAWEILHNDLELA